MFKKILIPVDGSVSAEKLIGWGGTLSGRVKAEVVLLAVADPVEWIPWPAAAAWDQGDEGIASSINPFPDGGPQRHSMKAYQLKAMAHAISEAKSYLEQQAERLRVGGVRTTIEVREGSPSQVIPEAVNDLKADLVVMSSRRTSALLRGVLGSVADRVIRSSTVPVLIVHPDYVQKVAGHDGAVASVLVPLDGSELSELAVSPAIELAGALNARAIFMQVLVAGLVSGEPEPAERDEAAGYLGQFVEMAKAEGVTANTRIATGAAASRIVEESEKEPGTIIAMGTHGRGGFRRFFLGSVTDKVVRSASAPVLVVPPRGE